MSEGIPRRELFLNTLKVGTTGLFALMGISGTRSQAQSSLPTDGAEIGHVSNLVFANSDSIRLATVSESVSSLDLQGFASAGDAGHGRYRRVAEEPNHPGKIQSGDGGWWELYADVVTPKQFGAKGGYDFTTRSGPDDTLAIAAFASFCAATNTPGRIEDYYFHAGQFNLPGGAMLDGIGMEMCGIQFEFGNTESGCVCQESNCRLSNMELQACLNSRKRRGAGHIGNAIRVGRYFSGPQSLMENFTLRDLKITRASSIGKRKSFTSPGFAIFGFAKNGMIDNIVIEGNHSQGLSTHWSADVTAIGLPMNKTWHPSGWTIGRVVCRGGVRVGMVLSSSFDVSIDQLIGYDLHKGFLLLQGDESNSYTDMNEREDVMRGISIGKMLFYGNVSDKRYADFIDFVGVNASRVRKYPDSDTRWKNQLRGSINIGMLIARATNPCRIGVSVFEWMGHIRVDHAELTGFGRSVDVVRSRGSININLVRADAPTSIVRSHDVTIRTGKIELAGTNDDSECFYIAGGTERSSLKQSALRNDRTIRLTAPFKQDIVVGDTIKIGRSIVRATAFVEAGILDVPVTPLDVDADQGATVKLDMVNTNIQIETTAEGGEHMANVVNSEVTFTGAGPRFTGRHGYYLRDGSRVAIFANRMEAIGRARVNDDALTACEFRCDPGSIVTVHAGACGEQHDLTTSYFQISRNSAENRANVRVFGTHLRNARKAVRSDSPDDYELIGCTDAAGNEVR